MHTQHKGVANTEPGYFVGLGSLPAAKIRVYKLARDIWSHMTQLLGTAEVL